MTMSVDVCTGTSDCIPPAIMHVKCTLTVLFDRQVMVYAHTYFCM